MFRGIAWLIIIWFAAKEIVPIATGIITEALYYAVFRSHTPAWIRVKERSIDLQERERELKKRELEEKRESERPPKGPIGFKSNNVEY